jgi:hypothetical protein
MIDAGVSPGQVESILTGLELTVQLLGRLGPAAWPMFEMATAVEPERRTIALAVVRAQAHTGGCGATFDVALNSARRVLRDTAALRDYPDQDGLRLAVECAVAASVMAGRIDQDVSVILTGPQRALTTLLDGFRAADRQLDVA